MADRLAGCTTAGRAALTAALVACAPAPAALAPEPTASPATAPGIPRTDIFVAPLTDTGGRLALGVPVNVTRRAGYDNQPAFLAGGAQLLYTSIREDAQADTWRVATDGRSAPARVTATPEGEYSPTPTPDGRGFSVVRVEPDERQRLWRFDWDGSEPELILPGVEPVGYHAWIGPRHVALFVLGEPPSLWLADAGTQQAEHIASDIGRSLQAVPGGRSASFVVRGADGSRWFAELRPEGREVTRLAPLPAGEGDHAWTPSGVLLATWSDTLWAWRRGGESWSAVADLAPLGIVQATRVAVSPAGDRVAIVGAAAAP